MSQFTTPDDLEKHHVRDVYNQIAPHFVGSRHKAWPRVEEFLLSLPAGSLIADVGKFCKRILHFFKSSFERIDRNIEHLEALVFCYCLGSVHFETKGCLLHLSFNSDERFMIKFLV